MGFIVNILQADIFICEDKVGEARGDFHGQSKRRKLVISINIKSGSMIPIASPGSMIVTRIAAAAKAAPDPNPPLEIPAKTTAAAAIRKNSISGNALVQT